MKDVRNQLKKDHGDSDDEATADEDEAKKNSILESSLENELTSLPR